MATQDFGTLGVLAPDSSRTILVIADDGELAVAIRERVDRAYALVKDVRPDEATEVFATCIPWPWMVIGNGSTLPPDCLELFANRPILIFWRGQEPAGLPRHTRVFTRFTELADAVTGALDVHFLGMKLAIGLGVDLPDGSYARSAELQALVTNHPHPFDVPLDAFRSATRVLATHGIPCRPARDSQSGTVSLVEAAGAAS